MKNERYISVVETADDCKAVQAWKSAHQGVEVRIIALSLEALEYLRQEKNTSLIFAWKLLPMEDIIDQGFYQAEVAYDNWTALHQDRVDRYLDVGAKTNIHVQFLSHAATAFFVCEKLVEEFKKKGSSYLSLDPGPVVLGPYYPDNQKFLRSNGLFKGMSREMFARVGIPIERVATHTKQPRILGAFFAHSIYEIAHAFYDRLRGKPSLKKILRSVKPTQVLISGWGRDISRAIDINLLGQLATASGLGRFVNILWRAAKIKKLPASTDQFELISLRETLKHGSAYGPAFSLFPMREWFKQLFFYSQHIRPRFAMYKKRSPHNLLSKLLSIETCRQQFLYNVLFAYHDAYLSHRAMTQIVGVVTPRLFLGSDSGGASARSELLAAQAKGVVTLSTPHGYQAHGMPSYNYLADKVLTHGPATAEILRASDVAEDRVVAIGTSHIRREASKPIDAKKVRLVLGTRSWLGLWSNYCSRHNVYDSLLNQLLSQVAAQENLDITIKSHPNGDYHEYYDLLVKKYNSPHIRHVPQGWTVDQIAQHTDILVCFEVPSLYIAALYLKIPIIFSDGAFTKTQAKLHYDYKGLGAVVKTSEQIISEVKNISTDPAYYANVMTQQNEFAKRYDTKNPEEHILELMKQVAAHETI